MGRSGTVKRFTEPVHMPIRLDIHQHLWPEPLLAALAGRTEAPRLVREGAAWSLRLPGDPAAPLDPAAHDPDSRAALMARDGIDRALIAPSSPLGLEALPPAEAEPLLAAYHEGVAALPEAFGAWAAVAVQAPDPAELDRQLDAGRVGACLPADAMTGPAELDRLGPVLETLERRGAPVLVHPGPAPSPAGRPSWWPALTAYVAGMQAAWYAWGLWGRPAHPRLRVCFAMLAGLAPLHRERLVARGGRPAAHPLDFYDTSSYGTRALDAVLREVGVDQLVNGSDRPVVEPVPLALGDAVRVALLERNPVRLIPTLETAA